MAPALIFPMREFLPDSSAIIKKGAVLADGSHQWMNTGKIRCLYRAVGISLPSSDAFLAEPSPAMRSRMTSL